MLIANIYGALYANDLIPSSIPDVVVIQSLSPVQLFMILRTAALQVSLSFTISRSLHKLMSIELVTLSVIPFSSCPQSFLASGSFPLSWFFTLGGLSIGASASASVLPMNIQGWFPLGLTGLISLLSKGLSRVFSSFTVQKHKTMGGQELAQSHTSRRLYRLDFSCFFQRLHC